MVRLTICVHIYTRMYIGKYHAYIRNIYKKALGMYIGIFVQGHLYIVHSTYKAEHYKRIR